MAELNRRKSEKTKLSPKPLAAVVNFARLNGITVDEVPTVITRDCTADGLSDEDQLGTSRP
ncbi:hypothetical protein [Mesorhizobium sp. 131-2-1]|uniref:hypothetical protein n=1 Tax=Mesorhizobium sp. 131-2-1 TaxID=2744518 RepID=UPI00192528B6|nr:hypothetical protein [Mesorhizobium sp. 131-2-1]BCG96751.1 hypothetical protein MesoLj131a_56150 [Mesorhizobium sp. 131-2-1]